MSTRLGGIEQLADPPRPDLEVLVRNLDRDTARSKRLIRQLMEEDPESFLRGASRIFKTQLDSRGAQELVSLVVGGGLLLASLSDQALTRENAMALAQVAIRIDPQIDIALARALADRVGETDNVTAEQYARMMEVLAAISDGARLFPSLVRLLRHASPHIRSKAVLMIGRGNRSAKWVQQRLADTDPRIRANAAEALWGVQTEEAREVLQSLVCDSNNRVAGNAILGLYRLGDCSMIPALLGMARHESTLFRATAAWVMGETGDPRFTEVLAGLLREPNAVVRKRAFAALGGIRAAVAQAHQAPPSRLAARLLEPDAGKPQRRLLLGAIAPDGPAFPKLLPTQILLNEDGQSIAHYRVTERPAPETLSVVFLFPHAGTATATACLRWKRPRDLWAGVYYTRDTPPDAPPIDCSPRFQSSAEAIAADWERIPSASDCADLWRSIAGAVSIETAFAGKRRLIIFSDPGSRPAASDELVAAVAAAQAFVQVISCGADPVMEEFCRRVNGVFWSAGADSAVQAYLTLFTRYEIVYQPLNPEARSLKIRLHGPGLCAEAVVALTSSGESGIRREAGCPPVPNPTGS